MNLDRKEVEQKGEPGTAWLGEQLPECLSSRVDGNGDDGGFVRESCVSPEGACGYSWVLTL